MFVAARVIARPLFGSDELAAEPITCSAAVIVIRDACPPDQSVNIMKLFHDAMNIIAHCVAINGIINFKDILKKTPNVDNPSRVPASSDELPRFI